MTSHEPTAPAGEPDVTVAAARFLAGQGASPLPATTWLITSISGLAAKLDGVLAAEGIACDRGLARYQKAPAR